LQPCRLLLLFWRWFGHGKIENLTCQKPFAVLISPPPYLIGKSDLYVLRSAISRSFFLYNAASASLSAKLIAHKGAQIVTRAAETSYDLYWHRPISKAKCSGQSTPYAMLRRFLKKKLPL
jgi:hypothetical protein